MIASPTYTQQNLLDRASKISCCSSAIATTLVDDEQQGVETCNCSWAELAYLNYTKKIFESSVPVLRNPGSPSTASIVIPSGTGAFNLTNVILSIGGSTVYSHPGNFATLALMLDNINNVYGVVTVIYVPPLTLTFNVPAGNYYNDVPIVLSFFDNGHSKATLQFSSSFQGGQSLDSFPPICLDDNSLIEQMMENTAKICGCSDCSSITDAMPQPNAIVINVVSKYPLVIHFTPADFVGLNYTPTGSYSLVGKHGGGGTPQFDVYSDNGSGTLLTYGTEYTFNSGTGTLIFPMADNFMLTIYS